MTVPEFQARRIERVATALAHFLATTPEDKLDWRAGGEARSALDQASECVLANGYFTALLRGEEPKIASVREAPPLTFTDLRDAQSRLLESAQALAAAVRAMSDEDLTRTYSFWRGPITGEVLIEMPYRNMVYHAGQINFIQCLLGDGEFHVPPTWM